MECETASCWPLAPMCMHTKEHAHTRTNLSMENMNASKATQFILIEIVEKDKYILSIYTRNIVQWRCAS